jgi:hypothetical protein
MFAKQAAVVSGGLVSRMIVHVVGALFIRLSEQPTG